MMQSDGWTERIEEVLPKWCVIRLAGWDALLKAWRGWMGGWKGHCNGIMVILGRGKTHFWMNESEQARDLIARLMMGRQFAPN
jgi:hypothetical protein